MTPVALRIVNDVSYVTRISHGNHFFVAGAVFGEFWTLVAPHIVKNVSCVKRIDHDIHFSWQAQYLVKLKCHFSWQAQCSVKFGMIAGARNVVFFQYKNARGGREKEPRLRGGLRTDGFHGRIMVGSIGRALEMTFHPFSANFFEILDGHFSWQAQYLVSLDYDACCSAHCK